MEVEVRLAVLVPSTPLSHSQLILVEQQPSTSQTQQERPVLCLPRMNVAANESSIIEAVCRRLKKYRIRRAIEIPLWRNDRQMGDQSHDRALQRTRGVKITTLVCLPVAKFEEVEIIGGRMEKMGVLLELCARMSGLIETQTALQLRRIDEWLTSLTIPALLLTSPAVDRVSRCAHNPSIGPPNTWNCYKVPLEEPQRQTGNGSEIDQQVARGNSARLRMVKYEKFDKFVMNPLFGTGLHTRVFADELSVRSTTIYERRGKRTSTVTTSSPPRSAEDWGSRYPLHKAAYIGDAQLIQNLLQRGQDPNESDRDSWTPLHYAAFYGRLDAIRALLQGADIEVNARNKGGATALHLAALNAHAFAVELMLSHPSIDINIINRNGQRAADLCRDVHRKEWQDVAKLLDRGIRPKKQQVDFVDLSNVMVELVSGNDTTAEEILIRIFKELSFDDSCQPLFALWIVSDRLSLQLRNDHKVMHHLAPKKWNMKRWGTAIENSSTRTDKPRLMMKRNAKCPLDTERKVKMNDRVVTLLYEEARQLFLKGFYPCNEKDAAKLAAYSIAIIYGSNHRISEPNLKVALPAHRIRGDPKKALAKITKEYNDPQLRKAHILLLQQLFLDLCRTFGPYGAHFFDAQLYIIKPFQSIVPVRVGVNDDGLHIINDETKSLMGRYSLQSIRWEPPGETRPYIDVSVPRVADFRITTKQAHHIHMLLSNLCGKYSKGTPLSSASLSK
ncbi:unnamed protein product, partial [Mesorhabditis belari]|uniref:FERM domain-containing protein n=1 Tax=Mesorhabditis belari TaxID=2138241 RepID=A0AAF3ECX5_9BILA